MIPLRLSLTSYRGFWGSDNSRVYVCISTAYSNWDHKIIFLTIFLHNFYTLPIYSLTLSFRTTPIGVFPDYFSFSHFLASSCCFYKKSSLNSALNFTENMPNFCRLSVIVCCCASNQYSVIGFIFSKVLKNSARSKD